VLSFPLVGNPSERFWTSQNDGRYEPPQSRRLSGRGVENLINYHSAEKEVNIVSKVERTVSCFEEGFSCSQALLSIYGEELGLDRETALKVAGAFGGGMGHMGETCGAVTGAFMIIGLKYGNTKASEKKTKERAYSLVKEFVERFKLRNGSIVCRELLGCDLSTHEGKKTAKKEDLFAIRCPKFVRDAAEIIEEIL